MPLSADVVAISLITSNARDVLLVAILKLLFADVSPFRVNNQPQNRQLGQEGNQKEDYRNWKNENSEAHSKKAQEWIQGVLTT